MVVEQERSPTYFTVVIEVDESTGNCDSETVDDVRRVVKELDKSATEVGMRMVVKEGNRIVYSHKLYVVKVSFNIVVYMVNRVKRLRLVEHGLVTVSMSEDGGTIHQQATI